MSASINTAGGTQPLDPYTAKSLEDPPLPEKIEDMVNFISEMKYGMLTTKMSTEGDLLESRCMALAGQEYGGIDLLFHTNLFTGKTLDLSIHPTETNMSFLDPVSGNWASLSGTASILAGPEIIQKYYTPSLKAWLGDLGDGEHDGGPTDPRIGIIRLETKLATYSIARKGLLGRAVESAKGAAKGDVPEINRIRQLSQAELNEWRRTHNR